MFKRLALLTLITVIALGLLAVTIVAADGPVDCSATTALADTGVCGPVDGEPSSVPAVGPTDTAYGLDLRNSLFISHTLNNFPGQTVIGSNADQLFAVDFDETATTLYAVSFATGELGTLDLATGVFSAIAAVSGVPAGDNVSGMTIAADGTAYISGLGAAGMTLYTIDLTSAVATPIGSDPNRGLMIDIAINCEGDMYGHDISDDSIYTIDTATGLATLVGPTGVNSNFAQGMDFDSSDGTLYAWTYQGGGTNQYGTINLATGALTPLSTDNPLGEFEGAVQTTCGEPQAPSLVLTKTVGLDPNVCATTDEISIPAGMGGTEVTYCYYMQNTGNVTLTFHTVTDTELGVLLGPDFLASVGPGAAAWFTTSTVLASPLPTFTWVNTATWVVRDDTGGSIIASDYDMATVTRNMPTGVALSDFGAEMSTSLAPLWLAALLALIVGFGLALRRKVTN